MLTSAPRLRLVCGTAAVIAVGIALIFATLGDGVSTPADAGAIEAVLLDHAHTLTWILLAVAFGIAAWRRRWTAWAGRFAGAALACYVSFVAALLLGR